MTSKYRAVPKKMFALSNIFMGEGTFVLKKPVTNERATKHVKVIMV